MNLVDFLSEKMWQVLHHNLVVSFGIPSEVVVARKLERFVGGRPSI